MLWLNFSGFNLRNIIVDRKMHTDIQTQTYTPQIHTHTPTHMNKFDVCKGF